jgi:hypothetical protein
VDDPVVTGLRRRSWWTFVVALVAAALFVVTAVIFVGGRSDDEHSSAEGESSASAPPLRQAEPKPLQSLRAVDWPYSTIPGSACGLERDGVLHNGFAFFESGGGGTSERRVILGDPITYGDLDGDNVEEAAVPVTCSGSTSSSALIVYRLRHGAASPVGIVTTTQPNPPEFSWPFIDNGQTRFESGKLTVTEFWYEPTDTDSCCPSTVATTGWRYDGTNLSAEPAVTTPRTMATVQREDFIGHWRVHGGSLDIIFGGHAMAYSAYGGQCAPDVERCFERMALTVVPSDDGQTLLLTIVEVAYYTADGVRGTVPPGAVPEIGDTFRLEYVFPHLIKATTLQTADPEHPNALGNPYLCGEGLVYEVGFVCGA